MSENQSIPTKAADLGLASCASCGKVAELETHRRCPRCGHRLYLRKPNSIANTLALSAAAAALYIPSHILPILSITELGVTQHKTIIAGMIAFWKSQSYPIALVIFCASILIPFLKIGALLWVCAAATGHARTQPGSLSRVYWLTELLGRWSMIDIFVVGILVSVVQLGNYTTIVPGPGALAFAAVVVLTMLAAMAFDPRLMWDYIDKTEGDDRQSAPDSTPKQTSS
ncbi:MAG: paraquat-inducible protein A [Akkermansiaceae bacterium]|nr:paraquat-inducible protein A [Akkermansiaceae bacterium]